MRERVVELRRQTSSGRVLTETNDIFFINIITKPLQSYCGGGWWWVVVVLIGELGDYQDSSELHDNEIDMSSSSSIIYMQIISNLLTCSEIN